MARILIDLTQFSAWPARTGVQRVLNEMLAHWPSHILAADICVQSMDDYQIIPLRKTSQFLERLFKDLQESDDDSLKAATASFVAESTERRASFEELLGLYDGYFLPEPTFRDPVLYTLARWSEFRVSGVFALLYDVLLQTNPEVYDKAHQLRTSRYFRLIAGLQNVACISRETQRCLEQRLRRRPAPGSIVLDLGADALGHARSHRSPDVATFVMVGTIEPRKRHDVVLRAFDQLWSAGRDYRLIVIGNEGWHTDEFIHGLHERAAGNGRLTWLKAARDKDISEAVRNATAAIYISELEGYGLPAVEALAVGCPLIAAANLPALAGLSEEGQIRLPVVNVEAVTAAVCEAAEPAINARLSLEAMELKLPKWPQFAHSLAEWIRRTLDASPASSHKAMEGGR